VAIARPPEAIAARIAGVQAVLQRQLGGQLRAVHLYGSAIDGGLKPCSDIDRMVAVAAPLPPDVRHALLHARVAATILFCKHAVLRALAPESRPPA
jgi:streptomycin 3"-adenylyltransferase